MSRLSDLLRAAKQLDPQLGEDLEAELLPLQKRLPFGLNFERHAPEAVELAGHAIRKGSKVRVLQPRTSTARGDQRLWKVESIAGGTAELLAPDGLEEETVTAPVEDLILVAEFRDRIYPGLRPDGAVERGGDKPFHTVINGENFHVLELLTFTHEHSVDAIYIDPPYNTGSRDWKYNNDYVEGDDLYRHSKWLAFMERRLKVAKRLLNPEDSVLIVTIDEKEYLRLGLLLEQTFPGAEIQMVTSVIAPQGSARGRFFKRSEEYIFCVYFGSAAVTPLPLGADWGGTATATVRGSIHWDSLKRTGTGAQRADREGMFYPVFLDADAKQFVLVGESPGPGISRNDVQAPEGCIAVWPLRRDGSEGRWQVGPASLRTLIDSGYARLGKPKGTDTAIAYLKSGEQRRVRTDYQVIGRRDDGSIITADGNTQEASFRPTTVWGLSRHSAGHHGSNLLRNLLPGRSFPFPKSLYAVEDVLRFFVAEKPTATVLDFFAGSGTTAHAVMRLNKQDGGNRQAILVTNNEVSAEAQRALRTSGLRPGDFKWEQHGICDAITKPRIRAAITGLTPNGELINGEYKFVDEFPMADGFEENAAFFTLTYESPWLVGNDRAFAAIAPMLWLRTGASGRRIDTITNGWAVAESYGVIKDLDLASEFIAALHEAEGIRIAYIVTDDEGRYQQIANEIPGIETVRLYEDYLRNCESNVDI
ncbi:DNA methyltransferase [Cryobacterium sp. PH29-G1]|uniref:site-specific DNA-methyltransferase n=1 Tax=Cryobacterium sp. PH29-G1 TaxID=3046211 RepID=UPI0024B95447|nr:DNA methyltransferase [Cryobacterium sp. PH29-G1]MDJ0348944.1 DNA methyltransferase [Cryobacterium sp. PH29-G1]